MIKLNSIRADEVQCSPDEEGTEVTVDDGGGDDVRSVIEAQYDALSSDAGGSDDAPDTSAHDANGNDDGGEEGGETPDLTDESHDPVTGVARERDPQTGRFVRKPAGAAQTATPPSPTTKAANAAPAKPQGPQTPGLKPGQTPPPQGQPVAAPVRAPQAWKPAAREAWAQVPPAAQQEIIRREGEIARTLQETAHVRQGYAEVAQAMGPFEGMIRAELAAQGRPYNMAEVIGNVMQTAIALRTAPPVHRGDLVAQMMMTYGIDVAHVEDALIRRGYGGAQPQGQPGPQGQPQPQPQQVHDPRLDTLLARVQQADAQRQAQARQSAAEDLRKFAESHEFYEDVKLDMAKLLRSGLAGDYESAYNAAVKLHPEISGVLAQREAAAKAGVSTASTQRARAAASSVRSTPTTPRSTGPEEDDDLRDVISKSWDSLEQRAK